MSQILAPFQLLELNVISAQDLAPVGRNMRTYAVAWVHPDRKLSTRVDTQGHTNPTWNDKFVFRVDDEFLYSDTSAIMLEIYALHWFKDIHVGTVRVLVGNLIPPPERPFHNANRAPPGMRFVALQVRRPSGRPQGILNIGFTVLDSSMRSMPLYTLNASAVGYRHLMGEKDAYDSHNHLSPHVFAAPKPELRRSKSDTSSMIAADAVARQHRAVANKGRANSAISGNEFTVEKKKKGKKKTKSKSKTRSVVSTGNETSSILSDTVLPWKVKNGKVSPYDVVNVEPPPPDHNHNDVVEEVIDNENDNYVDNDNYDAHSTVNTVSEIDPTEPNNVFDADEEEYVPVNNVAYEVRASPKPQFRNSPAPQFKNSPAPQFMNSPKPMYKNSPAPKYMASPAPHYKNSPAPEFMSTPFPQVRNSPAPHYMSSPAPQYKNSSAPQYMSSPARQYKNSPTLQYMNSPARQFNNSPAPQYMNSPAPQYKNSPAPQYMNSPAPQFKNSPATQYMNSPAPQFKNSPAPQYMNSPAPQFKNSPAPQYMNSPAPQYKNSPAPQYMSSPAPQFKNSPVPAPQFKNSPLPQYMNSPKPQFRNSPAPQFRNSPAVSKFNPVVAYGGSHRGTPMHPFGKMNGGFEYMTPRRSNLGNMGPVVMTESELGPSPSEVAAAMARRPVIDEGENSTVGGWSLDESVEGLQSKLERWRSELPPVIDGGELSSFPTSSSSKSSRHTRRHTDGGSGSGIGKGKGKGSGLFSCFSTICGVECSIVCGGDQKGKKNRRRTRSADDEDNNTSLL